MLTLSIGLKECQPAQLGGYEGWRTPHANIILLHAKQDWNVLHT